MRLRRTVWVLLLLQLSGCTAFKRCSYDGFGRRDAWQQPARVVEALALAPGDRVADLGAGGGYFTFRLAEAVGPTGVVYAVDVDQGMLRALEREAAGRGSANVETRLASAEDPGLPAGGVDLVFTANTYHHLGDRVAYFGRLRSALAPDGRVAILDYDRKGFLRSHYSEKDAILSEMRQAGYVLLADRDWIDRQSFLVFRPAAD